MQKTSVTKRQKSSQNATKRNAIYGEEDVIRNQPPIELKPSAIKTIELKPSAFLGSLKKELPDALSSLIEGKKPANIYQVATPYTDTGFNTIAWRDQDGSKLFLQNLNSFGAILGRYTVTYPEVEKLAQKSHWKDSLPDTIFVNLKSAGSAKSSMAAKTMVLGMLDDYRKSSKLPNKLILKEETKTDNPDHGESVITFSVKGITQIEPIMNPNTFIDKYSRVISDGLAMKLSGALNSYRDKLRAGVVDGFRVEEVAATKSAAERKQASKMLQEIDDAATFLLSTVNTEIDNKKQTKLTKDELKALETLQRQVGSAIKDGFNNELDTRRWQQWLTLKPLTEDQIVPGTGTQIGAGVQGPVFKYQLDPALARSPVILKYDNNGLNDDAKGAGIPELNPQQSVRAVAASKISDKLDLKVIPRTEFFVGTDDTGRPKLGQAMDVVNGPVGQRKAGLQNDAFTGAKAQHLNDLLSRLNKGSLTEQDDPSTSEKLPYKEWLSAKGELEQYHYDSNNQRWYPKPPIDQNMIDKLEDNQTIVAKLGNLDPKTLDNDQQTMLKKAQDSLDKYVKVNDQWYYAKNFPVNIAYGNSFVQKGLSDLQVFDNIIGHADRNPGNWIYEKDNTGSITGVKGIDNDDILGENWLPTNPDAKWASEQGSKTPGIPPIVDISTALSILNADFNNHIRPLLAGLSNDEIDKAAERFDQVQQRVGQRVLAGNIASMGDVGDQAKLQQLRAKVPNMVAMQAIPAWGQLADDVHTERNSYLGSQIAQKAASGVAPESGVGLALLPT